LRQLIRWAVELAVTLIIILLVYFASVGDINLDEGDGLYDANLILQGEIPFKDYITREPGYLYILALFIKVFGYSMMTGRLMSIIAGVVTCLFIFKIGKELYNKNVGLVAALIYCLSPYFIYYGIIGYVQETSLVWVPISMYFLILAIKGNELKYYLLSGLFIGIAMLFYRGHLVYLILSPLVLLYIHPWEFKNLFRNTATVLLGFCIPVVPVLAYLVLQTDYHWMLTQYMPTPSTISITDTVAAGAYQMTYLQAKSRVLYCLSRSALYLFIPFLVFLSLLLKNLVKNRKTFIPALTLLWAFVLYIVVNGRSIRWYDFGQQPMPNGYPVVFFYLLGLLSLFSLLFLANTRFALALKTKLNFTNIFLIVWFFCASIFLITNSRTFAFPNNIGAIPAAIMAAIAIVVLFEVQKGKLRKVLTFTFPILLILSTVFAGFVYINTPNPDRSIKMSVARDVGQYVKERTSPDDEILTIAIFAVEADRRIVFDISHPLVYVSRVDDPARGYDPYNIIPTITELKNYLEQHKIEYIVADPRTKGLFISNRHQDLRDYILENYTIEKSIDNVDIYARNR